METFFNWSLSFFIFLILDYFFSKFYKKVFTYEHVGITILGAILFYFVLGFLSPDAEIEKFVRLVLTNLLAEIVLYYVVIKYKLIKER